MHHLCMGTEGHGKAAVVVEQSPLSFLQGGGLLPLSIGLVKGRRFNFRTFELSDLGE